MMKELLKAALQAYMEEVPVDEVRFVQDPLERNVYAVRVQVRCDERPYDFLVTVDRDLAGRPHVSQNKIVEMMFESWPPRRRPL